MKADNLVQNNTPADAEANLDSSDYVFIDLRKADDYKAGHIKGAIAADMDACKGGDFQNGVNTMKAALKDATGSESGGGKKLVLICYSGKTYAQAGTNVFSSSARTWTTCSPSKAA
ncbi:rhodanese-like domain-containing protein [Ellagibacter isourolithinifaciens]|uniref:rhodanese-like domain-containing protein n=1 Tax=Ellagibacter isourolithinifaciens TaxID=2137581 RepID=UPI003AACD1E9